MVIARTVTPLKRSIAPPSVASDPLDALLRKIAVPPTGVPQSLWESALAGPVREFLSRPGKRFRAHLVELSWRMAGRTDPPPVELPLIVEILHAGSLIVDDIEDGSRQRRGKAALHHLIGLPLALNTGNWMYFWPPSLLGGLDLPAMRELDLYRLISGTLRRCHEGQALDLAAQIGDLHPADIPGVARTISACKTGSLMAAAAALGAIAAGCETGTRAALETFGERLGIGLQMQNDLSELTGAAGPFKHPEDMIHGRVTWPWAWAAERLSGPQFDALQSRGAKLARGTGDASALARDLLEALGNDPALPIRAWLAAALHDLERLVPDSPSLDEIRDEVERLQNDYAKPAPDQR